MDLEKLEKLEFNGTNSFILGESLKLIQDDFMRFFKIFQDSSYNCLDLECQVMTSSVLMTCLVFDVI